MLAFKKNSTNLHSKIDIKLNCQGHFGNHVTKYDISISKKGLKIHCQNTISYPSAIRLRLVEAKSKWLI